MTALTCALLITVPIFFSSHVEDRKWQRIYTGEDMIIDIDASEVTFVVNHVSRKVVFASTQIGRVRFRTIYSSLQTLKSESSVRYKTRLESIEFNCVQTAAGEVMRYPPPTASYRFVEATLLDKDGKPVKAIERTPSDEWKDVKFGSMMDKLSGPACRLIEKKRRNP